MTGQQRECCPGNSAPCLESNHLLKNLMADGLGCIELALNAEASAAGHPVVA